MNQLIQNVRYGLRQLRRSPGFTATVIVTLALGIGANTAIFTLFDQVLLRTLPVHRPAELVRFEWSGSFSGWMSSFGGPSTNYFSYPMYKDLRDKNQVFEGILAADKTSVGLSWHNQAENEDAEIVTGNYFQLLGLHAALGRLFTQADDTAKNANPVIVLSYDYWKTRFGSAPEMVGQTILINGHSFTVIGVAPPHFDSAIGGYRPGVFLPISMVEIAMPWTASIDNLNNRQSAWLTLVARRKPGVTIAQAQASLQPLWHSLRSYELTLHKSQSARFKREFVDESHLKVLDDSRGFAPNRVALTKPLRILMGMAALLMAMCAINVATLLLLRAAGRVREMSMRYALGAKRSRIVWQLLVEGGVLGIAGGAAGIAIAPVVARTLVRIMMNADPGSEPYSTSIDANILLYAVLISLGSSLFFSIAPMFHFLRPDLVNALRQNAGTASRGSQRFRKLAVAAQIALSVMLLAVAGLFVRTLDNLRHQQVGFDIENLTTFGINPASSGYGEEKTPQVVANVLDSVRRIPGVLTLAATTDPELSGDNDTSNFSVQGYKPSEDESMDFEEPAITPDYFATLHQPLLAGREFTLGDAKGRPSVAIVNLTFARRFFGTPQNAIGRLIARGAGDKIKFDTTIVGVVGDTRHTDLRTKLGGAVYRPFFQMEHPFGVEVYARTARAPQIMEPAIRASVRQLDPTLVVDSLRTMEEQVSRSASDERALAVLAVGFSVLAMVLAAVGLYGVLGYSIEQRTREIGVRLALGAPRAGVVVLVVREMVLIAGMATAIALPCVVTLARYFRSQLYGVTAFDPVTLFAAVLVTGTMVAFAAAIPARRAAAVEPMRALRIE